jgi:PST family polysaccharide transporter
LEKKERSAAYHGMLKATSALAGAKMVTIGVAVLRTKILAILLGPAGMGIVNVVSNSLDLCRVLCSCGIDGATVRRVANAAASNEQVEIVKAYRVSARSALILGCIATVIFACLSPVLAEHLLGDKRKTWWFVVASISLICTPLLTVELAFLQGLQKSKNLAQCQILASLIGSVLTIGLVLLFGINGGVIGLVTMVIASVLIHKHFVHKHITVSDSIPINNFPNEFKALVKMGSAFALNGIWITVASYLNIYFLTRYYGTSEAPRQIGLNSAAMTLANVYINILITAMGTEFYPRLIAASKDKIKLKELVNQQTRLSMAIGIPVSVFLLLFAPLLLRLLYSPGFTEAADLMRWVLFGMVIRFITCPIGFTVYASCRPRIIATNELLTGIGTIILSCLMTHFYGLKGVGIGLAGSNFIYFIAITSFMFGRGIHLNLRTLLTVSTVILIVGVLILLLCFTQTTWSFPLAIIFGSTISLFLLNDLRKETQISWGTIREKISSYR